MLVHAWPYTLRTFTLFFYLVVLISLYKDDYTI